MKFSIFNSQFSILVLVLALAALLRFWDLSNNPPGLTWDEAALGYNAYSILQTGRDEYGSMLLLNLKSFGDFKPALYAYITVPFVAIFGLNELAVRLPAALFGILGVFGVYLLVNQLFQNKSLALLSAFFLAISPWHIQFSRPAFEANVALTFNIFGVFFFLKGLERKRFSLAAIIFGFSLLTYQASRLFIPLLILALVIIYRKNLTLKSLGVPIIVISIFLGVVVWTFLSGQTSRLSTQNFFAYQRSSEEIRTISKEDGLNADSLEFQLLHGEWWSYTKGLLERYLIYFSPKMLFVDGDYNQRHRVPDLGVLYFFSVVLIPIGMVYFIKLRSNQSLLLFIWLLLSPIPAVLSRDLISTLRAFNLVLPLTIFEAVGFWWVIKKIKGYILISAVCLLVLANFLIYLDRYFIHAPKEYSKYWLYGQRQMVAEVGKIQNQYQKIVISDSWGQPYIYYLFYTKYPPEKFQTQAVLDQPTVDVGTVRRLDNIEFRHIYWPKDRGEKETLFIGTEEELPDKDVLPFENFNKLKEIKFLNGEVAFRIVEVQ